MIKILYVHGYNGKPDGGSFQKLSKYAAEADFGGEKVEMHSFDYDASKPREESRKLRLYYYETDIDLIIGSSLGGFLTAACYWARRIVINPCLAPSVELPKVEYTGPTNDYKSMEKMIGFFAKRGDNQLCVGCFAQEDELLGTKYKEKFANSFPETYDIPGGHHLSEEGAKKVMTEIAPMLIARFKANEGPGHIVENGLSDFERLHHAHMYSIYNEQTVKESHMCGCFYCGQVFPAEEVTETTIEFGNNPDTALCPYCMIDSILPDSKWKDLSPTFLDKMHDYFFS